MAIYVYICTIMASIYLHFPFCKSRCIYCDFFSTTSLDLRRRYVEALKRELSLRRDYLGRECVDTLYFGGGTPSQMDVDMLAEVMDCVYTLFDISTHAEVTMECNPDDLSEAYLDGLRSLPINRLSLGVQTFDDARLRFLHRRHSGRGALDAIERCRTHGYDNLSIDLIYGFPNQTIDQWEDDLDCALSLGVEHLSAYSLMYEEGTELYRLLSAGAVEEVDEELSVDMYKLLTDKMRVAGYRHYEISNFCKPSFHSRHNSGYWNGTHYLGVGAGAHSYNGEAREWNVGNLRQYLSGILEGGEGYVEREELDESTRINEMVMTSLRTSAGINLNQMENCFGKAIKRMILDKAAPYLKGGQLLMKPYVAIDSDTVTNDEALALSNDTVFVSNSIISDLFV